MSKINVSLYGGKGIFGGKETPLEADEIYCDVYNTCSFYKEGKCLRCRSFLAPICKFGSNEIIKGYTSRAKKYYTFKNKYKEDEMYNKLEYPNSLVGIMNDYLYMRLKFVSVRKKEDCANYCKEIGNGYVINDVGFGTGAVFIPLTEVTADLLYSIFSFKPHAIMGGEITTYQEKIVPDIIQSMRRIVPDIYNNFVTKYPQYNITPNYIGKKAYIYSLKPNTTFILNNYKWTYDGEYISTTNFDLGLSSPWWIQTDEKADVKLKVNEKMTIEINDNSIVDEDTKFE